MVVGEWSLATDNCAMWLNGFNDNVPGYPMVECERVTCPPPYMGSEQPGAPPNPLLPAQDPFGTGGESYVINGTCPRDRPFPNDDVIMKQLAYAKLNAFDKGTHGHFFWNFRTEFEPRWDYQKAVAKGWLPSKYDAAVELKIENTCNDVWMMSAPAPLTATAPSAWPWQHQWLAVITALCAVVWVIRRILATRSAAAGTHSTYTKLSSYSDHPTAAAAETEHHPLLRYHTQA